MLPAATAAARGVRAAAAAAAGPLTPLASALDMIRHARRPGEPAVADSRHARAAGAQHATPARAWARGVASRATPAFSSADPMAASLLGQSPAPGHTATDEHSASPFTKAQLLDAAATFVKLWFAGIAKGPQAVSVELAAMLALDVVLTADHVRLQADAQGLTEVLAELERAHLEYHASEHRPMLYGASSASQRAYALVEGRYQDVGALPGHPATFRISKVHHILGLQVRGGRVVRLWLRRQLTEEDKDELLHDPLSCYPAPFPRDCLRLADAATSELAAGRMRSAVSGWWQAWAASPINGSAGRGARSRADASAAAVQLLAPDFKFLDAYGLYPAMRAQGRRHLAKDAALRYMQQLAYSHSIHVDVLDVAEAEGSLACFSHWQARLTPRWPSDRAALGSSSVSSYDAGSSAASAAAPPPAQAELLVDGMAIDLFNEQLQLQVIWVFRGPISDAERQLFLEFDRQHAQAEAAQAASDQEAVREARRAQREQQLKELLTWMQSYQHEWAARLSHVQKQLARQQRLARAQLIQKLQEGSSLDEDESLDEEQEQQLLLWPRSLYAQQQQQGVRQEGPAQAAGPASPQPGSEAQPAEQGPDELPGGSGPESTRSWS